MKKEEVRVILNKQKVNFQYAVALLTKYFLEEPEKFMAINHVVKCAKAKRGFTNIDLFRYFYEYGVDVIHNTRFSRGSYSDKMLMKSVWENGRIQQIVVDRIRRGYAMYPVTEEDLEEIKKQKRKEQLVKQAAKMRAAKAKKRAERKAKEKAKDKANVQDVKKTPSKKEKSSKYTKEQLEQIEMLRKMRT